MPMAAYDEGLNESFTLALEDVSIIQVRGSPSGTLPCAHLPARTGHSAGDAACG